MSKILATSQSHSRPRHWATWIADHELALLALAAPLLFPLALPALTVLALLMIPLLWLARWVAYGRLTRPTWLDLPLLALMTMTGIGVLVSIDPRLSLPKATGIILGLALYYALINGEQPTWVLSFVPALSWGLVGVGLVGIDWMPLKIPLLAPIYAHLPRLIQGVPRTMGGGIHPNGVGGTLAMVIPLLIAWRRGRPLTWLKHGLLHPLAAPFHRPAVGALLFWATLAATGGLLILTQSRTALLATALILICLGLWQSPLFRWLTAALVMGLGILIVLTLLGLNTPLAQLLNHPSMHTWAGRPEIWHNALQTILDYPLTGIGLNTLAFASRLRYAYLIARPDWDFVHAHNLALQIGVDLGVIGLAAFAGFMVGLAALAWRAWGKASSRERWVIMGGLLSILGYLTFGSIDTITLGAKTSPLFWLAAGLIAHTTLGEIQPSTAQRPVAQSVVTAAIPLIMALTLLVMPPATSIAYANWGHLALIHGRYVKAVDAYQKALHENPGNRSALRGLAEAHALLGDGEYALMMGKRAGLGARFWSDRGASWFDLGYLDRAAQWQRWALELDPQWADAWYRLALVQERQGKREQAEASLEQALALSHFGGFPVTEAMRHYLSYHLPTSEASTQSQVASLAAQKPLAQEVMAAGHLLETGETTRAITHLRGILDRDDSLAAAWTLLGQAYAEQQEWDQAILAFQEALALDPDQYEANHDLAKVQALRKAWDRVIDLESRALAAAPDDRRWAESALTLLQAYEAVGAHEETCRLLEQLSERLRDPALDVRIATIWDCTSTP